MGIHFFIAQVLGSFLLLYFMRRQGGGMEVYYENAVWMTGAAGILTAIPMLFLYRRDSARRREAGLIRVRGAGLSLLDGVRLFVMGAALAQFVNFLMTFLVMFLDSDYQETMAMLEEGKGLLTLIFWMGIVAPAAEEMIFRWVVYLRLRDVRRPRFAMIVSGVLFGIYHGNVVQAIYASILGCMFAWLLEMSGNLFSCVLLHMGANVWALIYPELALWLLDGHREYEVLILPVLGFLAVVLAGGLRYFSRMGRSRGGRCV